MSMFIMNDGRGARAKVDHLDDLKIVAFGVDLKQVDSLHMMLLQQRGKRDAAHGLAGDFPLIRIGGEGAIREK